MGEGGRVSRKRGNHFKRHEWTSSEPRADGAGAAAAAYHVVPVLEAAGDEDGGAHCGSEGEAPLEALRGAVHEGVVKEVQVHHEHRRRDGHDGVAADGSRKRHQERSLEVHPFAERMGEREGGGGGGSRSSSRQRPSDSPSPRSKAPSTAPIWVLHDPHGGT